MASHHIDSAVSLLGIIPQELRELEAMVAESEKNLQISDLLRVRSFDYLSHCRSVLDYLAQELATICTPPLSPKIYFPIVRPPKAAADFPQLMNKWFPGLQPSRPDIFNMLEGEQYYHSNDWILSLADITNETKHV
jgi:hypothetical protein